jgi:capping protein alpha
MSESEGEYEEASPEQKLNIANYFIMSSPTGEVDDVLADVNKLVADPEVLSDDSLVNILKSYNNEQMTCANDSEGSPVLVTAYGQVADDEYLDPATGRVLKFDHRKRQFNETTDKKQELDGEVKKFRDAVDTAVKEYVEAHYKQGKCNSAVYGSDDGNLTVCVSGANVHLGNFWTGGWKATYKCGTGSKNELKGDIKVNVHYFEDGNVQLHSAIDKTVEVDCGSPEAAAKEIAKAIETIESDFQNNLEQMLVNLHRTTFKSMRRFLPISRQPMNWTTAAHSLADQVSK